MILQVAILFVSLFVLIWSADKFVYGAAGMARNFGISPMVIGLTIVAMGSSAPEMMVAASASLNGNPNTAIGNAIGSNITNIALVLGVTALIKPLEVSSTTLKRELPILLLISLVAFWMLSDVELTFVEGAILMTGFFAFIFGLLFITMKRHKHGSKGDAMLEEAEQEIPDDLPTSHTIFWLVTGMILLPVSASWLVDSAVFIARSIGVSDLVIGLTVIAIGTSLPELAASVVSLMKKEDDLAMGNIIGSNIFNILAVLSLAGLIAPGTIDPEAVSRDAPIMMGVTLLLLILCFGRRGSFSLTRTNGGILFACFIGYQALVFSQLASQ